MMLQIMNDTLSLAINEVINTSIAIHELTGGGQFIKGVNNSVTGSIVTLLIAGVIRFFEKRKMKKRKNDK